MCAASACAISAARRAYSARDATIWRSRCPARPYSSSIRWPSAPEHWSEFCLATTSRPMTWCGPAAQPSRTPGKKILEQVPACSTTSGASDQRLGGGGAPKPSSR